MHAASTPGPIRAHLGLTSLAALLATALSLAGPPAGSLLAADGWLWLRIPLGLTAVLLLPGHALTTLVFPRSTDLDGYARVGLAVGLSLVQIPFLALALDHLPWGLSPGAIVDSTCCVTVAWCLIGAAQLGRLGAAQGLARPALIGPVRLPTLTRLEWVSAGAGLALVALSGWALASASVQGSPPPLTEFFLLGSDGVAEDYPRAALPGQPLAVAIGLTNHEQMAMDYRVVAVQGSQQLAELPPFRVAADATWSERLTVVLPATDARQRLDILLFRATDGNPYRRLELVFDALQAGVPTPVRAYPTPGRGH